VGDGIYDGTVRVASTTTLKGEDQLLGADGWLVYEHLRAQDQVDRAMLEAHPCVRGMRSAILLEVPPDMLLDDLNRVAYAAFQALVTEVWVRVDAEGHSPSDDPTYHTTIRNPGDVWACSDTVTVGWDEAGAATVVGSAGETVQIPARVDAVSPPGINGLDVASIAAAIPSPRWAYLDYEEAPPPSATVQQAISLWTAVARDRPGAAFRGRWSALDRRAKLASQDPVALAAGPAVPALYWDLSSLPTCGIRSSVDWVCEGLDGAIHPHPPSSRGYSWVFGRFFRRGAGR
jgi:hypothetical protein